MPIEIDHIAIAVEALETSLAFYRDILGFAIASRETVAAESVHVAMLPAGGTKVRIELLEATSSESPIARFIAKRGPGLHHIAFKVDDLDAIASRLAASGYQLLDRPKIGAGGHSYVFVHPRSTGGVLLELVGRSDPSLSGAS